MGAKVENAESVKKLFILSKDYILMTFRVFHFMPPYTCSVFSIWNFALSLDP
jgi:hypothetical protein